MSETDSPDASNVRPAYQVDERLAHVGDALDLLEKRIESRDELNDLACARMAVESLGESMLALQSLERAAALEAQDEAEKLPQLWVCTHCCRAWKGAFQIKPHADNVTGFDCPGTARPARWCREKP